MAYHSLFRAITTNPALSLVILSYHPPYTKIFQNSEITPPPSNLSFDNVIPYPVLSRQILPYHLLSLAITNLITKIFSRTQNHHTHLNLSFDDVIPYPVLSRQSLPHHFVSLTITNLITKSFSRTLKSPHPFEFILWWRHSLSRAITTNHALSLVILSYHPSYNQDFSEL